MGPWRGLRPSSKHIRHSVVAAPAIAMEQLWPHTSSSSPLPSPPLHSSSSFAVPNFHGLLGWGSQEFLQLGSYTTIVDVARGLQPTATPVKFFATGEVPSSSSNNNNNNNNHRHTALPPLPSSHPLGRINPPLHTHHCNQVLVLP